MKRNLLKAFICLLMVLGAFMGITSAAAAEPEDGNYDGWSFTQWVTFGGETRGAAFGKFYGSFYMDMRGTAPGASLTFESAGNGLYYLRSWCAYKDIYLCKGGQLNSINYYLSATSSKSSALKWRLGDDGRLYTTINSTEYYLWLYTETYPYNGSDGFRLSSNTQYPSLNAVNYRTLPLTPPEMPHVHPLCGESCQHEEFHEDLTAYPLSGKHISQYGFWEDGDYYLTGDSSWSRNITIDGDVRLCLNGYKLNFTNGYGLKISGSGSLTLCDCQGSGGINSYPKYDDGYYIYENRTIDIYENASLTIYGADICADSGSAPYNEGTLTLYDGLFGKGLENRGTAVIYQGTFHSGGSYFGAIYNLAQMTIYDCTADSGNDHALRNSSNATIVINGGTFRSTNTTEASVCNRGTMTIYDADISCEGGIAIDNTGVYNSSAAYLNLAGGTVSGRIGISNGSYPFSTKHNEDCSTVRITGGTISGTECDVLNSARISSATNEDGTESRFISRGILEIDGAPAVRTIVLEQPKAFHFGYTGVEPLELEIRISEDFTLGDTVWFGSPEKISSVNLVNEGCYLEADGDKVILGISDPCAVLGHRYESVVTAPTCTEQGYTTHTCAFCGDSYTDSYTEAVGHSCSAGLCTTCGTDTVAVSLVGNTLSLSGELENGTQIIAAGYDSCGRFCGAVLLVWQGIPLTEELPTADHVRLFFPSETWTPLRQPI